MKKLYPVLAAIAFSAAGVQAEWLLNTYATTTADSIETNAIYGFQTFQNTASAVTIKVTGGTPGYVSLIATKVASNGTDGYTANIGMLHPLTSDWAEHDLTGLTGVSFEYQNTAKITDVLSVSFGSKSYTDEIANAGTVYEATLSSATQLAASTGTTWKTGEVSLLDFATPTWWTAPAGFPTIDSVLKRVKNLQFAPKTLYTAAGSQAGTACTKCVSPTMTAVTLNIRNVKLLGDVKKGGTWPNPDGLGCTDAATSVAFSDFASESSKNAAGGYFFPFSDFDTLGTSTDKAKGKSLADDSIVAGADEASSYYQLLASLNKKDGTYHQYSGWAALGSNFGTGKYAIAPTLSAIGFWVGNLAINDKLVETIDFKVKMNGVSDTALHIVSLPTADIVAAGAAGKFACIRPIDLKQAAYVSAAHTVPFSSAKIDQIAWEAKITDNKTPSIDTATANFYISDVQWYGLDAIKLGGAIGVNSRSHSKTFAAYSNGVLSLSGFSGVSAFDVTTLDGKVVASFASAPRVSLALPRGTYLLTAKNGSLSQKFAVVGR
jgi:hypothetical protein